MSAARRLADHGRADVDKDARRYFVYRLADADGSALYIGRSCNVVARIRSHHSEASGDPAWEPFRRKAEWFFDVRSVSMVGPFTWDAAVAEERRQIEREQPRGNISLTARDHRPGVASRSAARAAS